MYNVGVKEFIFVLLLIALISWILFRLFISTFIRWLSARYNVSIGKLGVFHLQNIHWQLTLPTLIIQPYELDHKEHNNFKTPPVEARIPSSTHHLERKVQVSIGSARINFHWGSLWRRSPVTPNYSGAPTNVHAFTLSIDRVMVKFDVREANSCIDGKHESIRSGDIPFRFANRSTGMFKLLLAQQLKSLSIQMIIYILCRWMDLLLSRFTVLVEIAQSLSTSPHVLPLPCTLMESIQESVHICGVFQNSESGQGDIQSSPHASLQSISDLFSSHKIDVRILASAMSLNVDSCLAARLPDHSEFIYTTMFAQSTLSFVRPSWTAELSQVFLNASNLFPFINRYQNLIATTNKSVILETPPLLSKLITFIQQIQSRGQVMPPHIPTLVNLMCPLIEVAGPLDLISNISGLHLAIDIGQSWCDCEMSISSTNWTVADASAMILQLSSLEFEVMSSDSSSYPWEKQPLRANSPIVKPVIHLEFKIGGLDINLKHSSINEINSYIFSKTVANTRLTRQSTTSESCFHSTASSRTPSVHLLNSSRRFSRLSSFTTGIRSRRLLTESASLFDHTSMIDILHELVSLMNIEFTITFVGIKLAYHPIDRVSLHASVHHLGLHGSLSGSPLLETEIKLKLESFCFRLLGHSSDSSSVEQSVWILVSMDNLTFDSSVSEIKKLNAKITNPAASSNHAGTIKHGGKTDVLHFDLFAETQIDRLHIEVSHTRIVAETAANILITFHDPKSPVSPSIAVRPLLVASSPSSRPLIVLNSTSKYSFNQLSFSISGEHQPAFPKTMSAETGILGTIDYIVVTHSGKHLLGALNAAIIGSTAKFSETPLLDNLNKIEDILHALRVDEIVCEICGLTLHRNPHRDDLSSFPGTPYSMNDSANEPILVISRVSIEHKIVDTGIQSVSDMNPRLHQNISTIINMDKGPSSLVYCIPVHLLLQQFLMIPPLVFSHKLNSPPSPESKSITSLTSPVVKTYQMQISLSLLEAVVILPHKTRLKLIIKGIKGRFELGGGRTNSQTTLLSMDILASQSFESQMEQQAHPTVFLGPQNYKRPPWQTNPMEYALLAQLKSLEINSHPNEEILVFIKSFELEIPFGYYLKDVVENLSLFIKTIKPDIPPSSLQSQSGPHTQVVINVRIDSFNFSIEDDPFEVQLSRIFRNGADQQRSRIEREKYLALKLDTVPGIDPAPFWYELSVLNVSEWIRIMALVKEHQESKLLLFKLSKLEIIISPPVLPVPSIAASCNYLDKETPSDAQFNFEFSRQLSFHFSSMLVQLRDHILPLVMLPPPIDRNDKHVLHGLIILVETRVPPKSVCTVIVPVVTYGPQPFIRLRNAMSPIKLYSSLEFLLKSPLTIHWGPSVEPPLVDVAKVIDMFTNPSLDSMSPPLPWWDKLRWQLHGKIDIQGETLMLHALGSRNPYFSSFSGDGSHGAVLTISGHHQSLTSSQAAYNAHSKELFGISFSSSMPCILRCSQMDIAIVQPLINHSKRDQFMQEEKCFLPWDIGPVDVETVMSLTGSVLVTINPIFNCGGTPPSHHNVFCTAPEHVENIACHDSFVGFRSLNLSLEVDINCESNTLGQFSAFSFTPFSITYASNFIQFNIVTKSTRLRRGTLFPLSTPKFVTKKLGLFLSQFLLRVDMSPVLLTLWHKNKAIHNIDDAVGLRAVVDRCWIDFLTQRHRSSDTSAATPSWFVDATDIDFTGFELMCIALGDSANSSSSSTSYAKYEHNEKVRVRLANNVVNFQVKSTPFLWSPKISYCRSSDVDYGRESSFGRDTNRVQLDLLQQYLTNGLANESSRNVVERRIQQLMQADMYSLDQDDYLHSAVIHNARFQWNVGIRNNVFKFIDLQEQSYLLNYYASNASLRILRDLRELLDTRDDTAALVQLADNLNQETSPSKNEKVEPTSPLPFRPVLEKLARRASSGVHFGSSTSNIASPPPAQKNRLKLRKFLERRSSLKSLQKKAAQVLPHDSISESRFEAPISESSTLTSTPEQDHPANMVTKSVMIRFINPQIKLCTVPLPGDPEGICIITTENTVLTHVGVLRQNVLIKNLTNMSIFDANFTISAEQDPFYRHQSEIQSHYDVSAWLPLEYFFLDVMSDPGKVAPLGDLLPHGFHLVVHRAETHLKYQRLNPAISDQNIDDANLIDDLDIVVTERDLNSWELEFSRFTVKADFIDFAVIFNIVGKLLIYREPTKARRQEQLDLIMLASQADDVQDLLDSIFQLRSDIAQLRLTLFYDASVIQGRMSDGDETEQWLRKLTKLSSMQEKLLVVMESFKLMNSSEQQRVQEEMAAGQPFANSNPGHESPLSNNESKAINSSVRVVHETIITAGLIEWFMLDIKTHEPFVQWMLTGVNFSLVDMSDQSRTLDFTIQQLFGRNMLPNPIYEEVANLFYVPSMFPAPPGSLESIEKACFPTSIPLMLQVHLHELAPVAGISIVELFEVRLSPIKIQMTHDLGKKIKNYLFPKLPRAQEPYIDNNSSSTGNIGETTSPCSLPKLSSGAGSREGISNTYSSKSKSNELPPSNEVVITQMKSRASSTTNFVKLRMPSVAVCISYRGTKEKNIEDIHEFILTLPTFEYHSRTWTWLEFLSQVKRDVFFAVIGHTGQLVKEKFFSPKRPVLHLSQSAGMHLYQPATLNRERQFSFLNNSQIITRHPSVISTNSAARSGHSRRSSEDHKASSKMAAKRQPAKMFGSLTYV